MVIKGGDCSGETDEDVPRTTFAVQQVAKPVSECPTSIRRTAALRTDDLVPKPRTTLKGTHSSMWDARYISISRVSSDQSSAGIRRDGEMLFLEAKKSVSFEICWVSQALYQASRMAWCAASRSRMLCSEKMICSVAFFCIESPLPTITTS
jgi:hypothetical protein